MRTHDCHDLVLNFVIKLDKRVSDKELKFQEFYFDGSADSFFSEGLGIPSMNFIRDTLGIFRNPRIARWVRENRYHRVRTEQTENADFLDLLDPDINYTFVIHKNQITFAKAAPSAINNLASKHGVLRDPNQAPLMAGEMWIKDGVFYFNADSGTFKPSNRLLETTKNFFEQVLLIREVRAVDRPIK